MNYTDLALGTDNVIPPITHPLGKQWQQPSTDEILIDETFAVMTQETFKQIPEYSTSNPTGVYEGKMWKCSYGSFFCLKWFGYSEKPDACSNNQRVILLLN